MSNDTIVSPHSPLFPEVTRDELLTDLGRAAVMARISDGWAYYRPEFKGWMVWDTRDGRWVDSCQPWR